MNTTGFSKEIEIKNLDVRQTEFVRKLIQKGGEFYNNDLANYWGTKNFPPKFKKLLLQEPPVLILVQARPQKYKLKTGKLSTTVIEPSMDIQKLSQNLKLLKIQFNEFKTEISSEFQIIFQELDDLKTLIQNRKSISLREEYKMGISDLENEILMIYNRLKIRSKQPIKIESVWEEIIKKHPNYKWKSFASQILKISSRNYHLEEGIAGRCIFDPINNKKYGYVIGN